MDEIVKHLTGLSPRELTKVLDLRSQGHSDLYIIHNIKQCRKLELDAISAKLYSHVKFSDMFHEWLDQ